MDPPDGVDLDGNVDMEWDGDDEAGEDNEEGDTVQKDEVEEENEDEDDDKEPQTIDQGEMVNTLADNVDAMVDDQAIMQPEQGQKIRTHTPWPQPPAAAQQPRTPEPFPRQQTLDNHSLSGYEFLALVRPRRHRLAVPTLRDISKMYFRCRKSPGVSERMWSVNLDASMSGSYQTLGGHSGHNSE